MKQWRHWGEWMRWELNVYSRCNNKKSVLRNQEVCSMDTNWHIANSQAQMNLFAATYLDQLQSVNGLMIRTQWAIWSTTLRKKSRAHLLWLWFHIKWCRTRKHRWSDRTIDPSSIPDSSSTVIRPFPNAFSFSVFSMPNQNHRQPHPIAHSNFSESKHSENGETAQNRYKSVQIQTAPKSITHMVYDWTHFAGQIAMKKSTWMNVRHALCNI